MDESPRWLVQNGRIQEAYQAIRKTAKYNKTMDRLPYNLMKKLEDIHTVCIKIRNTIITIKMVLCEEYNSLL